LSDKILHRLGATITFLEVYPGFAQDQIEQRFENTSPTLAFARCASGVAYEQPARYRLLDDAAVNMTSATKTPRSGVATVFFFLIR
jgi:hypothetical protein